MSLPVARPADVCDEMAPHKKPEVFGPLKGDHERIQRRKQQNATDHGHPLL